MNTRFTLIVLLSVVVLDQVKVTRVGNVIRIGRDSFVNERNGNSFKEFITKQIQAILQTRWITTLLQVNSTTECILYEPSYQSYLGKMKAYQPKTFNYGSQKFFNYFFNLVENAEYTMNNVKALNVPTFTYYRKEMQLNSLEVNTMYFIVSILIIAAIIKINRTKISNTIPKRRLLTMEEYNKEAQDFTAKQLEDLKEYCTSPGCNAWKLIRRLNRPDRFAQFVEAERPHINEEEMAAYAFNLNRQ